MLTSFDRFALREHARSKAISISAAYFFGAVLWIAASDRVLLLRHLPPEFQTVKGFAFVAVTSIVLGIYLYRTFSRIYAAQETLFFSQFATEHAPDAILWVDPAGKIVYMNSAARSLAGVGLEAVQTLSVFDIDPHATQEGFEEHLRATAEFRQRRFERFLRGRDGELIPVEVSAAFVEHGGKKLNIAYARDIRERRAADERLKEGQRNLSDFVNSLPAYAFIRTADGKFALVNRHLCEALGRSEAELLGKTVEQIFDPSAAAAIRLEDKYVIETGEPFYADNAILATANGPLPVISRKVALRDAGGRITGLACVMFDISERKQLEETLHQSNAALHRINADLKQFAYAAAHDLREPLRNISQFAQMLLRMKVHESTPKAATAVQYIVEGTGRMEALVRDLLSFAEVARSEEETHVDLCDGKQAVMEALQGLSASLSEAHADVEIGDVPTVRAAKSHIVQLIQNLVGNAIKYRDPERPLKVRVWADTGDHFHTFHVSDNGIGIKPEYYDRIFGLFKRLHHRDVPGTGIGLALCRRLVDVYEGRIWVESEYGVGSTFHFELPSCREVS